MKTPIVLAGLFLMISTQAMAQTCMTEGPFPFKTEYTIERCPEDIQGLLNRMNACAHFSGEEATDSERQAFIEQSMKDSRCADIGCDFETVFRTYEGDIAYTGVLFEYARVVYGSDEAVPECANSGK